MRERAVCGYVRPRPRRRRGAHCAARYGWWLLSEAHPPPSPFGVACLFLVFCWSFSPFREVLCDRGSRCLCSCLQLLPPCLPWERLVANFLVVRPSEAGAFLRTLRARMAFPLHSPPTGCRRKSRTGPNFRFTAPIPRNRATVRTRTFSTMRKSAACPCYLLSAAKRVIRSSQSMACREQLSESHLSAGGNYRQFSAERPRGYPTSLRVDAEEKCHRLSVSLGTDHLMSVALRRLAVSVSSSLFLLQPTSTSSRWSA